MNVPTLQLAKEAYQARDYAVVVEMLGPLPRDELLTVPEQGVMLADAARKVGGAEDLLGLVEATIKAAREQDEMQVLCRALNLQGVLLLDGGHVQAAERAWYDLVIVATQADNSQFVARASNNLGITATLSMRLEQAITDFQRAINAYLRLGYARGLAQSHHNLGIVYRELNHEQKAHDHFHRAITFARTGDLHDDIARAEEELALVWLYISRDTKRAAELASSALQKFKDLRQPTGSGNSLRVLGLVELTEGNQVGADDCLQSALRIARDRSLRLLEAETLLGLAALEHLRKSEFKETTLQRQARGIFLDIGAGPWGEQVQRRMHALRS